jgi:hypothetical protein
VAMLAFFGGSTMAQASLSTSRRWSHLLRSATTRGHTPETRREYVYVGSSQTSLFVKVSVVCTHVLLTRRMAPLWKASSSKTARVSHNNFRAKKARRFTGLAEEEDCQTTNWLVYAGTEGG